jgi:acetyl esterase/lipase
VAYDKPDDIRITRKAIPGLKGAPDVPAYLYEAENMQETPLLIAIHGGSFTGGRPDFDANRITYYVRHVPCRVLSVEYRLAPEGEFPKSLEDCYAALLWAYSCARELRINRERIAVAGYSAGGTLAAGLCLYARDYHGPKICAQILTFPVLAGRANSGSAMQFYDDSLMLRGKSLSGIARDRKSVV